MRLSVMPKGELIAYKRYLNGNHQQEDIEALSRGNRNDS
jgi:hypothetical protein